MIDIATYLPMVPIATENDTRLPDRVKTSRNHWPDAASVSFRYHLDVVKVNDSDDYYLEDDEYYFGDPQYEKYNLVLVDPASITSAAIYGALNLSMRSASAYQKFVFWMAACSVEFTVDDFVAYMENNYYEDEIAALRLKPDSAALLQTAIEQAVDQSKGATLSAATIDGIIADDTGSNADVATLEKQRRFGLALVQDGQALFGGHDLAALKNSGKRRTAVWQLP